MSKFEKLFLDTVVELSQMSDKLGDYIEREMYDELDMEKPDSNTEEFKEYLEVYRNKFDDIVIAIVAEMQKLDDATLDEINGLIDDEGWRPLEDKLNEVTLNLYGRKFY